MGSGKGPKSACEFVNGNEKEKFIWGRGEGGGGSQKSTKEIIIGFRFASICLLST